MSLDRRDFLKSSAYLTGGLILALHLPGCSKAHRPPGALEATAVNAWLRIGTDNTITLLCDRAEMGQGVYTALPTLLAEELGVDLEQIRVQFAPAGAEYTNKLAGTQITGASTSVRDAWQKLRLAGAQARTLLVSAAASQWGIDPASCKAVNGFVLSPHGRRLSFGECAAAAAKLPAPKAVALTDPANFRLIGTEIRRLDTPLKVNGSAQYGIDVRQPGMLYAVVSRCPVFGGKVASFDAAKAQAVPGVKRVVQISSGIAVVADNTWTAMEGRRALEVKWDEGPNAGATSAGISKLFAERAAQPGYVARKEGDAEAALGKAATKVEAVYEVPFLAHATMEPQNCTAHVRADRCDVWAPTQAQTGAQSTAAEAAGLRPEVVSIHTTFLGGGFGRRFETDFVRDAVEVSKAMGAPVKVTWSREDDIQHDYYRTASYARFTAGLDADGWPVVWMNRIACPSIMARFGPLQNNFDPRSVEICDTVPYDIPNILVDYQLADAGIPIGFWRSVGASQNGFFLESFADEVATAGKKDPYELRRRLLAKSPRHRAVLDTAAQKAGWGSPLPAGHFRGIATVTSYFGYVAQVVEISLDREKRDLKVQRVVCALDCGRAVNPSSLEAQAQSSIVYGLSAALRGAITIDRGRVQQSNFNNYPVMRIHEMPAVEVHIMPSELPPTGAGEFTVPPIAPALCNAIFAATGRRVRRLPIQPEDLA